MAGLAYDLTRHQLAANLDQRLRSVAVTFERSTPADIRSRAELASRTRSWLAGQVVPPGGAIAVRTGRDVVRTAPGSLDLRALPGANALLHADTSRISNLAAGSVTLRALADPILIDGKPAGTLVVAGSIDEAKRGLSALLFGIGWATALGVALATVLGLFAIRRILRPLRRMSRSAQDIEATGDLSRRVGVTGPADEVGRLAASFDDMLAKLEESFRSQQRFLSEASHELRTPITVIRGRLELLQHDGAGDPEALHAVVEEIDRMARIVDHLLLLARLDEGMDVQVEPVEAELLMREALLRGLTTDPRPFSVDADPGLFVFADPERLLQVLTNLVRNAVHHAGANAALELTARAHGSHAVLTVADTGDGIDDEDLPHVFDRFYRGSSARRHTPTGAGLGLPIVASLVEAMAGHIEVASRPGRGTTFAITLPRAGE